MQHMRDVSGRCREILCRLGIDHIAGIVLQQEQRQWDDEQAQSADHRRECHQFAAEGEDRAMTRVSS